VYIPFVAESARNYAVLHIPIDEVHVFQTKERAPYLICIEVYRPDELSDFIKKTKKKAKKSLLDPSAQPSKKDKLFDLISSKFTKTPRGTAPSKLIFAEETFDDDLDQREVKRSKKDKVRETLKNFTGKLKKQKRSKSQTKALKHLSKIERLGDIKASNPLFIRQDSKQRNEPKQSLV